jgi:molybdenum cofactor biosynthesis enzyme MoaA
MGVAWLVVTGGEPLVRADLFDIIALAKQEGLKVHLSTNGSLVGRYQDRLAVARLDSILTSIDGPGGNQRPVPAASRGLQADVSGP